MASAWPRTIAVSRGLSFRGGSGSLALAVPPEPISAGFSGAKVTSSSGVRASARMQPATARLNGSCGASFGDGGLRLQVTMVRLRQHDSHSAFRQLVPEAARLECRDQRSVEL